MPLEADTICVHGDTPGAAALAAAIRRALEAAGVVVAAIGTRDGRAECNSAHDPVRPHRRPPAATAGRRQESDGNRVVFPGLRLDVTGGTNLDYRGSVASLLSAALCRRCHGGSQAGDTLSEKRGAKDGVPLGARGGGGSAWAEHCRARSPTPPSGYCSASRSSFASPSTVVPCRFHAPSVSKRSEPMRRPHGEMTRPMARQSARSACCWSIFRRRRGRRG